MKRNSRTPSEWEKYCAFKDVVPGTRFIPFKTPYRAAIKGELFTPEVLMRKISNLGFVVNLVKTDRYYNASVYCKRSIRCLHHKLEGQGKTPSNRDVEIIFKAIATYVESTDDDTKLIGVHCTHGVNRTGYIICRYMIEKLGVEPERAVQLFEEARGHTFKHQELVDNLKKLSPKKDRASIDWHSLGSRKIISTDALPDVRLDLQLLSHDIDKLLDANVVMGSAQLNGSSLKSSSDAQVTTSSDM